jgi:hypothetical protein
MLELVKKKTRQLDPLIHVYLYRRCPYICKFVDFVDCICPIELEIKDTIW